MDTVVALLNFLACVLLAAICGWGVLSNKVRDGVVIKFGLILLALGFGGHAWALFDLPAVDLIIANRAQLLVNAGLLCIMVGGLWRATGGGCKRASDWVDLDEGPRNG